MEIQWKCDRCGQPLVTDSKYAGAKVECPSCKTSLTIPDRTAAEIRPLAAASTVVCPSCGREWPTDTVVCTSCGTKISTGEPISAISAGGEPVPDRILSAQVVGQAWTVVKAALGSVVLAFFVYMLVVVAAGMIPVIGNLASILIGAPLLAGWSAFCLRKVRGQESTVGTVFSGFDFFGRALGAYLLTTILIGLGTIFLIVPGMVLAAAFSLTYFFIIDQGQGP